MQDSNHNQSLEASFKSPHDVLRRIFGYDEFRGHQEEIIDAILKGQSCAALMPTGSGKSLCYQIPAIYLDGTAVIVSPLIALMNDQVLALKEAGVRAEAIHSGLDFNDWQNVMSQLRAGTLDLIYVAPERLMMPEFQDILSQIKLCLLAIDEAHCISQWGHDFRPEYRQISELRERFPNVPCLAVTATADGPTRKDIVERLHIEKLYIGGFDRPNIRYEVAIKDNPRAQLQNFLKTRKKDESGIIYCLSRKKVEETAQWLQDKGYKALPYHARLDAEVRAINQERFLKEEGMIIVATIAFGMGINKPDVRFVMHLDLPKNIEAYYQETGRAGRDGLPAIAYMVYGLQDLALQRQMIENSEAPEEQKRIERQKLTAFLGYCESATCRRSVLLKYFDDQCEPCGNCDTCLNPPKTFDGSIAAQKFLSCIIRTGQTYGSGYIIDVLLGKTTERMEMNNHQMLSTFGIGTEHTSKEWQSITRQLAAYGLIYVDMDSYGALKLTEQGKTFLKEKPTLLIRLDPKAIGGKARSSSAASDALEMLEDKADIELFEELKALRLSIAKDHSIPPYVVFHDKTLIEMALQKPQDRDELGEISGVGYSKLEKYGDFFLDVIAMNS